MRINYLQGITFKNSSWSLMPSALIFSNAVSGEDLKTFFLQRSTADAGSYHWSWRGECCKSCFGGYFHCSLQTNLHHQLHHSEIKKWVLNPDGFGSGLFKENRTLRANPLLGIHLYVFALQFHCFRCHWKAPPLKQWTTGMGWSGNAYCRQS